MFTQAFVYSPLSNIHFITKKITQVARIFLHYIYLIFSKNVWMVGEQTWKFLFRSLSLFSLLFFVLPVSIFNFKGIFLAMHVGKYIYPWSCVKDTHHVFWLFRSWGGNFRKEHNLKLLYVSSLVRSNKRLKRCRYLI